jgi:hypothetical protein
MRYDGSRKEENRHASTDSENVLDPLCKEQEDELDEELRASGVELAMSDRARWRILSLSPSSSWSSPSLFVGVSGGV